MTLYDLAESEDIDIISMPLRYAPAFIIEKKQGYSIALSHFESQAEEMAMLAHELGHCLTGSIYDCTTPPELQLKYEHNADAWAINALCPLEKIQEAIREGYDSAWEIADYIGVPETLVKKALRYYTENKGMRL